MLINVIARKRSDRGNPVRCRILDCFVALLLAMTAVPAHAAPLKVVASFSILGDMARQVAGDNAAVTVLVGPNSDTHVYEPTPADATTIASTNLIIVNGLGFEGWITRLIAASGYKGPVVTASAGITPLMTDGQPDPHAWQNVANGEIYVANIRNALIAADPAHSAQYRANAARYLKQLAALDQWIKGEVAKVPQNRRRVITSHDAFHYFAAAYGTQFIAPLNASTDSEASATDIAHLIDQVRAQKVSAVFMENITDPRLIRQLETDGHAYAGGTLYSDALSNPQGAAATYIAMFKYNVTQLVAAMMHKK